ncbi:hypothetical protein FRACYDRAFT_187884 [Fragilariopsis cylindrus CCMP1102]|uniref:FHA domain-containing protein n=1 Tax=Fragilariopsis cylindrus CCMP1102 TaxID=635003 RepID=A0A1E7F8X4_9STRA|nr:hypothetical protein FRACYDRAFT_187884 [Fragilariopsis cylindrus CCMP1102]|eukprot:OEU14283.1 hypothetical protein FRACYDRAFT_187884 [Fragilariopsis cylindrus CCMP1102]
MQIQQSLSPSTSLATSLATSPPSVNSNNNNPNDSSSIAGGEGEGEGESDGEGDTDAGGENDEDNDADEKTAAANDNNDNADDTDDPVSTAPPSPSPSSSSLPPPKQQKKKEEDDEEEDDDDDDIIVLGGERKSSSTTTTKSKSKANSSSSSFALLDGLREDTKTGTQERITIDITALPAVFGRSHEGDTNNPNFFGLGKIKALSRKHCTIYYRDIQDNDSKLRRLPKPNPDHLRCPPTMNFDTNTNLPTNGFYVIENLGKNRILVDLERIEQGDSIVLRSGSAIRYVRTYVYIDIIYKIASSAMPSKKSKKKKSMTATTDSTITTATEPTSYATTANGSNTLKEKNNSLAKEMEALPVKSLLEIMNDAVSKGLWERKHQIIGSTLCYHAVRSAGSSKEIQQEILDNRPGVSRTTIMEWIEHSKQYKRWVQQMLSNMEPRSYQASITKSLLKAGFSRTSGAGRYM